MFKKLVQKLRAADTEKAFSPMTSPIQEDDTLLKLSKHALSLYERKNDIKNFTKLVLSDPENDLHNRIMDKLFSEKGVYNPFSDESLSKLSKNSKLLRDLGLDK